MKEQDNLVAHLQLIVDSINAIVDYLKGIDEEEFFKNAQLQDACLMRLIVIGEYSAKIPQSLQEKHPEIEWKDMKAARNFYVHSYIQIDARRIWATIQNSLLPLKNKLEQIIQNL